MTLAINDPLLSWSQINRDAETEACRGRNPWHSPIVTAENHCLSIAPPGLIKNVQSTPPPLVSHQPHLTRSPLTTQSLDHSSTKIGRLRVGNGRLSTFSVEAILELDKFVDRRNASLLTGNIGQLSVYGLRYTDPQPENGWATQCER